MYRNKHPHGNMAVLIGATDFGQGTSAAEPLALPHPTLPEGDAHSTPRAEMHTVESELLPE